MNNQSPGTSAPVTVQDYIAIVKRRKWSIVVCLILSLCVSALITLRTKPRYRTVARLLVEDKASLPVQDNTNFTLNSIFSPAATLDVDTQVLVVQSQILLQRASGQGQSPA